MVTTAQRSADLLATRRVQPREIFAGVDGGGTKTHAVVMDQDDNILGEGHAGPSNPLRVGITVAAAAIREAIDRACAAARIRRSEIVAIEIGLAGARRKELSARMEEALRTLGIREIEVVGDAEIALFGATDGEPGVVVIAGTGSVSCGINARHRCNARVAGGRWLAMKAVAHGSRAGLWAPLLMPPTVVDQRLR